MTDLLTALTRTLEGQAGLALLGAFLWGVASILLSPCHLASVPLLVAYTGRSTSLPARRAASLSTVFALGILVTVTLVGLFSVAVGRLLTSLGSVTNYIVAALLFVVGLDLLGAWPARWPSVRRSQAARPGVTGAFLFGLAFGTALGPCTFAFLGPVIGLAVQVAATRPMFGMLLIFTYAVGHCGVLAAAGSAGPLVGRYVSRSERPVAVIRGVCGAVVLAGGLYLVYAAP